MNKDNNQLEDSETAPIIEILKEEEEIPEGIDLVKLFPLLKELAIESESDEAV